LPVVLTNTDRKNFPLQLLKLEYPYKKDLGLSHIRIQVLLILLSPGSIASGSWTGAESVNGNNNLPLASNNDIMGYK
jgi:hypothetical protein